MKAASPRSRALVAAGVLSLAGQVTALAFMLHPTPYTTLGFVGGGSILVLLGMGVFAWVQYRDFQARSDGVSERSFEAGQVVFRQGEPGDCVYVVKDGEVEVLREQGEDGAAALARLGPGEYFGEMALLSEAPRNATVRAATRVDVLRIRREAFLSLYAGLPTLRAGVEAARRSRTGGRSAGEGAGAPGRPAEASTSGSTRPTDEGLEHSPLRR